MRRKLLIFLWTTLAILTPGFAHSQLQVASTTGIVSMEFSEIDFRNVILLCAKEAGTDALLEKSVRKKVRVSCQNEHGLAMLKNMAEEIGLRQCEVGEVTVFYQMPYNAFRKYNGPDDYTDFFPKAMRVYRERLVVGNRVRLSIKAEDVPLRTVLSNIATKAGIEFKENVAASLHVWVDLSDVTASDAFVALCMASGYGVTVEDGAWVVGRAESFASVD